VTFTPAARLKLQTRLDDPIVKAALEKHDTVEKEMAKFKIRVVKTMDEACVTARTASTSTYDQFVPTYALLYDNKPAVFHQDGQLGYYVCSLVEGMAAADLKRDFPDYDEYVVTVDTDVIPEDVVFTNSEIGQVNVMVLN
jgi:hypothetical protein